MFSSVLSFFFSKQKKAYEMRISDWSSDVCSSDLQHPNLNAAIARTRQAEADVAAARATKRPDWSFDVAYQRRADRYGDMVSAGVTISLPLFAGKRQDPMNAASRASASAALAEPEDMRRALVGDIETPVRPIQIGRAPV